MNKKDNLVRIYPGVRRDQKKFLQEEAKRRKVGEGEMHRIVIDYYKANYKQNDK